MSREGRGGKKKRTDGMSRVVEHLGVTREQQMSSRGREEQISAKYKLSPMGRWEHRNRNGVTRSHSYSFYLRFPFT